MYIFALNTERKKFDPNIFYCYFILKKVFQHLKDKLNQIPYKSQKYKIKHKRDDGIRKRKAQQIR